MFVLIRYIDLFAGMGGMRLGLEQALQENQLKGKCLLSSEIKSHAIEVYKANFAEDNLFGDVTKIKIEDIPDFDVLLAGFPCQSFSAAGKRRGFEDTRGTLFFEVARILDAKKPQCFLLENVENLVLHDPEPGTKGVGRTFSTILRVLEDMGYHVTWKVLQASDYGVAQIRRRVYIVGSLKEPISLDFPIQPTVTFGSIQEHSKPLLDTDFTRKMAIYLHTLGKDWTYLHDKAVRDKRAGANNIHSWDLGLRGDLTDSQKAVMEAILQNRRRKNLYVYRMAKKKMDGCGLLYSELAEVLGNPETLHTDLAKLIKLRHVRADIANTSNTMLDFGNNATVPATQYEFAYDLMGGRLSYEFTKIIDPNKLCLTLVATDVAKLGVVDGMGLRKLTLAECLRLQGFPDDFKLCGLSNPKIYDLLGNSVAVPVIKMIADRLVKSIIA